MGHISGVCTMLLPRCNEPLQTLDVASTQYCRRIACSVQEVTSDRSIIGRTLNAKTLLV